MMAAQRVPVIVRGAPLDPALGLPVAVVREKRWNIRLEIGAGILLIVIFVWAAVAWATGHPVQTEYGPLIYLCLPGGLSLAWFGWRRIKRGDCVIVAERGFDDRSGDNPAGPILWSEVVSIGEEGKWHLALHPGAVYATRTRPLVIELVAGPRGPLSPLGPQPRQIRRVAIETNVLEGGRKRLPDLMQQAHERWLERRVWDEGW
jgi:hypothetical protein